MADPKSSNEPAVFHAGMKNAWLFAGFNGLSFQIMPGIIAGMMPLMVVFQIPAAQYINRIRYPLIVLCANIVRHRPGSSFR